MGNRNLPGRVVYLGVICVLTVDQALLPKSISVPKFSTKQFRVGDEVEVFALDDEHQLVQKKTQISAITGIVTRQCSPPRWRITNTEGISLQDCPYSNGGILLDPADKSVLALWMTVASQNSSGKNTTWKTGLNFQTYIKSIIESLERGEEFQRRCCGWEFEHMQLASTISLGLSRERANQMASIAKSIGAVPRPIFVAGKLRPPTQNGDDLKIGDVILNVNGRPVGRMADVRDLAHLEDVTVVVLRNKEEKTIQLHTRSVPIEPTGKIVCWGGAVLHHTHAAVLEQTTPEFVRVSKREEIYNPDTAVYISSIMYGSPAIGNLRPVQWILEVDGRKVRTLDDMEEIIADIKNRDVADEYVRVRLMGRKGITSVVSVRLDNKFWPSWSLQRVGDQWLRKELC
jgi:S1-C subfamily serine protease